MGEWRVRRSDRMSDIEIKWKITSIVESSLDVKIQKEKKLLELFIRISECLVKDSRCPSYE